MPDSGLTLEKQASVFSKLYLYYIEQFPKLDEQYSCHGTGSSTTSNRAKIAISKLYEIVVCYVFERSLARSDLVNILISSVAMATRPSTTS